MSRAELIVSSGGRLVACLAIVFGAARAGAQGAIVVGPITRDTTSRESSPVIVPVRPATVATPAGARQVVEIGSAVAGIDASELVRRAAIRNPSDLLTARVPGVQVTSGVQSGAGMSVRIRGSSSLFLSTEPLYVIDGMRMLAAMGPEAFVPETGGSRPGRVGDLAVEDIAHIQVLRGPSATTLYGIGAANGVVLITTKRGDIEARHWIVTGEGGLVTDQASYPTAFTAEGHAFNSPATRLSGSDCRLTIVASTLPSRCVVDSVRSYNLFEDPDATPLGWGRRYRTGVQLSGGSSRFRYFLSGARENETSPVTLPPFELARLSPSVGGITDHERRPNALGRNSARANVDVFLGRGLDVGVSTGYIDLDNRFVGESGLDYSLGFSALAGPGYTDNGNSFGGQPLHPLHGYAHVAPGEIFHPFRGQSVQRLFASANVSWHPVAWWTNRASVGADHARHTDLETFAGVNPGGFRDHRDESRSTLRAVTADVASTMSFSPASSVVSRTTLGAQYLTRNRSLRRETGYGTPATTLSLTEVSAAGKTIGVFAEQQLGFRDRLFVNGALRTDAVRSLEGRGRRFDPNVGASWIASREGLFGRLTAVDELRLRAAYGVTGTLSGASPLLLTVVGPERASELEGGVDARLFGDRAHAEVTVYRKRTTDVIVSFSSPQPPPVFPGGVSAVDNNAGAISNDGIEVSLGAIVARSRNFGLDITVTGSANRNRLLDLGNLPPMIGVASRAQVGYPVFGYWGRPLLGFADRNGDGLITYDANPSLSEITVGDTAEFIGSARPTRTLTLMPGLDLFGRRARITSMFDYRGGHYLLNQTEQFRCAFGSCAGTQKAGSSAFEQARAVAWIDHPSRTLAGFVEPASFTRWRELTVTLEVPERAAARYLRARGASLSVSGRNLHVWTSYTGIDPEADSFASAGAVGAAAVPRELFSLAPPSYYSVRLSVVF